MSDLGVYADGAVAALNQANGRTADVIAIADTCEKHQRAVLLELNPPPWWQTLLHRTPSTPERPVVVPK